MEDIKILEDVLKDKDTKLWIGEQGIQAIENLIAGYKELEEEIEKDKMKIDFLAGKKLIEVKEHAKQVKIEFDKNYIPKSKVKEKIEFIKCLNEKLYYEENVISILQELLED